MTEEQAIVVERELRRFYNDKTGEVEFPEIIVNGEDVSCYYENLYLTAEIKGMPKINVPLLSSISHEDGVRLVMGIYEEHKNPYNTLKLTFDD